MDPMIWSRFPFQIMEIIFLCLPFSTLIHFRIVCKEWNVFLQNLQFLSQCNRFSIKEFGFLVPFLNVEERSFIGTYIHQKGCTPHLLLPFIERTCKVSVSFDLWSCYLHQHDGVIQTTIMSLIHLQRNLKMWVPYGLEIVVSFLYYKICLLRNMTGLL